MKINRERVENCKKASRVHLSDMLTKQQIS